MGKKQPNTPRSRVRAALRQLWLRSRERAARLKTDEYKCQRCGVKQSTARGRVVKVQVHHTRGIEWEQLINLVYEHLLVGEDELETLCVECHCTETYAGSAPVSV